MIRIYLYGLGFALLCAALPCGPALARVTVCNHVKTPIFAAIGYVINGDTETAGWWQVAPAKCTVVDAGPMASPFYLMTRTDPDKNGHMKVWGAGTPLVVSLGKFHFYDTESGAGTDTLMNFEDITKADGQDQPNATWTVKDAKTVVITYDETP